MKVTKVIKVIGMHCNSCETVIEETVNQITGIFFVKADYVKSTVTVSFDASKTSLAYIHEACAAKGYTIESTIDNKKQYVFKIVLSILALSSIIFVLMFTRKSADLFSFPVINLQVGNGMVFLVGLFSGLHCVGMCGSFLIGYTAMDAEQGRSAFRSHLFYGAGKTLSYAMFGALFGFVGSLLRITPLISGLSICFAGAFLVLYGLNMLNILSALKAIRIKQPIAITRYATEKKRQTNRPFFIGFFSGFIFGCGPLQAMYVMAAGNGNALEGAQFLTLFGLGTLPALLGFGLFTRVLSNTMTRHFIHASGVILIVMGLMMVHKGLLQSSSGDDLKSVQPKCQCHK